MEKYIPSIIFFKKIYRSVFSILYKSFQRLNKSFRKESKGSKDRENRPLKPLHLKKEMEKKNLA
jgi:hypothetical protein